MQGASTLPLVLASFSLNGTFLRLEEELTQQILLCKDRPSRARSAWRVGVQYYIEVSDFTTVKPPNKEHFGTSHFCPL